MGRTTNRIARGLAAGTAALTISGALLLSATPAHAASHISVDHDHIVLGASSTSSFKAFDGDLESWHDGSRLRGTLSGPYVGRGTLAVKWYYADGATGTSQDYTAGTQHNIAFTSSSTRDVVRFEVSYTPNTGTREELSRFVGDSPDSLGTCEQLDRDSLNYAQDGYASWQSKVTFSCDQAGNNVVAKITGLLKWGTATGSTGRAKIVLSYADGTTQSVVSSVVAPSNPGSEMTVTSPSNKDVLSVGLVVQRDGVDGPAAHTERFGDG